TVNLVIRNHQQFVRNHLKSFNVYFVIKTKDIYTISIKLIDTDINEDEISWLNGWTHTVPTNVDNFNVIGWSSAKHRYSIISSVFNGMNHINDITALDKAISRTGTDIQHFNTEYILHLRNILTNTVFTYSITFEV